MDTFFRSMAYDTVRLIDTFFNNLLFLIEIKQNLFLRKMIDEA